MTAWEIGDTERLSKQHSVSLEAILIRTLLRRSVGCLVDLDVLSLGAHDVVYQSLMLLMLLLQLLMQLSQPLTNSWRWWSNDSRLIIRRKYPV
jgi:hypothetical protein